MFLCVFSHLLYCLYLSRSLYTLFYTSFIHSKVCPVLFVLWHVVFLDLSNLNINNK